MWKGAKWGVVLRLRVSEKESLRGELGRVDEDIEGQSDEGGMERPLVWSDMMRW